MNRTDRQRVGESLVEHSKQFPLRPREVLEELGPSIEVAAQRLSGRAIARWLQEEHGIAISYGTIHRYLRERK